MQLNDNKISKPIVGHGNYVDTPVENWPDTLTVRSGESFSRLYVPELSSSCELPPNHLIVEDNANVDICIILLPGTSLRIPLVVDLVGKGSNVSLSGVYLSAGTDRVAIDIDLKHRVPDCISNQVFNGIVSGNAVVDFAGKIIVAPDAQKTDAYQVNHNILLSDSARVNAKPQLEIYADDVKCSHGASIGQLDEDAQFYMRSRGIPLDEAKVLQMLSFISPVLGHIQDPSKRAEVAGSLESEIRKML